jgi:DNA-binding phage protein
VVRCGQSILFRKKMDARVAELAANRVLAMEYLKAALQSLDDPDDRAVGLLALRTVAEAYGGLGAVAAEAGISRESLYRALSPRGQPDAQDLARRAQDGGVVVVG